MHGVDIELAMIGLHSFGADGFHAIAKPAMGRISVQSRVPHHGNCKGGYFKREFETCHVLSERGSVALRNCRNKISVVGNAQGCCKTANGDPNISFFSDGAQGFVDWAERQAPS